MNDVIRLGVLGLIHDHVWDVLPTLGQTKGVKLVAAADPNEPLRARVEREFGCVTYGEYKQLLEGQALDAVLVYSDNRTSAELATTAVERGLHVLIEKPLAADLPGAQRLVSAAEKAGVRLMVNWPFAWWPQLRQALEVAEGGQIGDVWQVRYRAAHAGPRESGCSEYFCRWLYEPELNGGGALVDYCCYGALLARVLLGMPSQVLSARGKLLRKDAQADDNGVLVMSYPNAMAIAEASWTQIGKLTSYVPTIYGSRGTLLVEPRAGGRLILATADDPDGTELPVPALLESHAAPLPHFIHAIRTGEPFIPLCRPDFALDVQRILDIGMNRQNQRAPK